MIVLKMVSSTNKIGGLKYNTYICFINLKIMEKFNLETKPTLFDKLKWWLQDVKHYPKEFITGVKNLWKWFPTIWKDRDWDSHFIYEILKVKITNQSKYISSHNRYTMAKRDAEIMMLTTRLIQHCQDDTYDMEYMDYHESEIIYNKIEGKDSYEIDIETKNERFKEYFAKYPRQYKRVLNGDINMFQRELREKDDKIIAMEIAHENQKRCRKLLHKILEGNLEKWWD
jgi:hypothetical protein